MFKINMLVQNLLQNENALEKKLSNGKRKILEEIEFMVVITLGRIDSYFLNG